MLGADDDEGGVDVEFALAAITSVSPVGMTGFGFPSDVPVPPLLIGSSFFNSP